MASRAVFEGFDWFHGRPPLRLGAIDVTMPGMLDAFYRGIAWPFKSRLRMDALLLGAVILIVVALRFGYQPDPDRYVLQPDRVAPRSLALTKTFFETDVNSGKQKFYSEHSGWGTEIPGVDQSAYEICYRHVNLVQIQDRGDARGGDRAELGRRAIHRFAQDYNRMMRQHLDRLSGKPCTV